MSSHHIVRDQQEPALIIHRIAGFQSEHLHALLEWSPTVVCCEPGLTEYVHLGHKVDIALVSLSSFEHWKEELAHQQPLKILAINDTHFLTTGLTILLKENHQAVNIITDEESVYYVLQLTIEWIGQMDIVLLTPDRKMLIMNNGLFKKWLPAGSHLSIMSLADNTYSSSGFDKNLNEVQVDEQELVTSREGEVSIRSDGTFVVIEAL